jgi:hypothetical protein
VRNRIVDLFREKKTESLSDATVSESDEEPLTFDRPLPSLFGWRPITFRQALGFLLLCRILFGGFESRSSGHSNLRRRLEERCASMTPEERGRIRERSLGHLAREAPPETMPNA